MKKMLALLTVGLVALCVAPLVLAAEATLPDGMAGFRGILRGTIVSKADNSFVLKVEKIGTTWKENKATNPAAAVGKELTITVSPERERMVKALAERKAGDRVDAGAMNTEGNTLTLVEVLKKVEAEGTTAPTTSGTVSAEEAAKLRARIAEMEKQIAALKAENEALRKQLAAQKTP